MNKGLLDKIVSLYTEIGNIDENIKMLEANKADLLTQLNEYEIVTNNAVTGVDLGWAKWVAADENGEVYAYKEKPSRDEGEWRSIGSMSWQFSPHEHDIVIALCGRLPKWEDEEPTPVKNK